MNQENGGLHIAFAISATSDVFIDSLVAVGLAIVFSHDHIFLLNIMLYGISRNILFLCQENVH